MPLPEKKLYALSVQLKSGLPVIGAFFRKQAAVQLVAAARSNQFAAILELCRGLINQDDKALSSYILDNLAQLTTPTANNALWTGYAESRWPALLAILKKNNIPAETPAFSRVISLITLNMPERLEKISADTLPGLIQAVQDRDPQVDAVATQSITRLKRQETIDALCETWVRTRKDWIQAVLLNTDYLPSLTSTAYILIALLKNRPDLVMQAEAEMVPALIQAAGDPSVEISKRALECMPFLQKQAAIDNFCLSWINYRLPWMEQIITQAHYVASAPPKNRLLTALLNNQLKIAQAVLPENLIILLDLRFDKNSQIAQNAKEALLHLELPETQDQLCHLFINTADPDLLAIAITAGYTPQTPEQKALYYLLSNQWAKYEAIDFDQRLLRAVYISADRDLKQRIAKQIQLAGKPQYLVILSGAEKVSPETSISDDEADVLIRILVEHKEWARLWDLALTVTLLKSIQILRLLKAGGWQPDDELLRDNFLKTLNLLTDFPEDLIFADLPKLPPAIARATVRVSGRVNDVAFHPKSPWIGIATANRKVVIWDYQHSKISHVVKGFDHSVGKIAFTPSGTMLAAERSNTQTDCAIWLCTPPEPAIILGKHSAGSVTGLIALNDKTLLSAGRDQKISMWDLEQKKEVRFTQLPDWTRALCVNPDGSKAVAISEAIHILNLSNLEIAPFIYTSSEPGVKKSAVRDVMFGPDNQTIISAQNNGQVVLITPSQRANSYRRKAFTTHRHTLVGLGSLPSGKIIISGDRHGEIRFSDWQGINLTYQLLAPIPEMTSLQISPDGAFMVTGHAQSVFLLWDLRVIEIPNLINTALSKIPPAQLSLISSLNSGPGLPKSYQQLLSILEILIRCRYPYDIQISEMPCIQEGEFDILIDQLE
jgi:WD40 repeat protein